MSLEFSDLKKCANFQSIVSAQPGTYANVKVESETLKIPVIGWKIMDTGRSIPFLACVWDENTTIDEKGNNFFDIKSIKFGSTEEIVLSGECVNLDFEDWFSTRKFQSIVPAQPGTIAHVVYTNSSDRKAPVPIYAWKITNEGKSIPIFPHGQLTNSGATWDISIDSSNRLPEGISHFNVDEIVFNRSCDFKLNCDLNEY